MVLGLPQSGMYQSILVQAHSEITRTTTNTWGEVIGPCPKGGWQGPMTSLLDPGVPWSTLEGQGPERVPQGPE